MCTSEMQSSLGKSHNKALGLYTFIRGLSELINRGRRAGEGGLISGGGTETDLKYCFGKTR